MKTQLQLIPFVDRQDELRLVRTKLAALSDGRRLFEFILTISGIPGIGKTRFLEKIGEEAKAKGSRPSS